MKKLFISLLFCLGAVFATHAQFTTIVNSSFSENEPVERGSEQYIDFIITNNQWTTASRFRLAIRHNMEDEYETKTPPLELMNEIFHEFYPGLPQNPDDSYRVYFNLPDEYPEDLFEISINLAHPVYGRFGPTVVTSLKQPTLAEEETNQEYYTLQGQRVEHPRQGIYIRKTGQRTERIYIP